MFLRKNKTQFCSKWRNPGMNRLMRPYIYIYMRIYIYIWAYIWAAPSNGSCWNPKGLLNDSLSHPFSTRWRVQVYDLVWISCGEVVKREACRKNDACISLYLLYICSYHPSKQTASNRNSARSHGQQSRPRGCETTTPKHHWCLSHAGSGIGTA